MNKHKRKKDSYIQKTNWWLAEIWGGGEGIKKIG